MENPIFPGGRPSDPPLVPHPLRGFGQSRSALGPLAAARLVTTIVPSHSEIYPALSNGWLRHCNAIPEESNTFLKSFLAESWNRTMHTFFGETTGTYIQSVYDEYTSRV